MKWKSATEYPEKPGYYLTYYWNDERKEYLFKAFVFSKGRWWYTLFEPKPIAWWDKHFDFYIQCQTQPNVDPLPSSFINRT